MTIRNTLLIAYFLINIQASFLAYTQSIPPIVINNNSKYANDKEGKVNLIITMPKATEMMLSNSEIFLNAEWESYNKSKEWLLENQDGLKTIFVKFRDPSNRESTTFRSSIILDRTPPEILKMAINDNAKFTNSELKQVNITFDVKEATHMMIANDNSFIGSRWVAYNEKATNWILFGNDGEKTVYAKFKDQAGNETMSIKAGIILDRTPPGDLSIKINNGNTITNNSKVSLWINAKEAKEMIIKEGDGNWIPFQQQINDFELKGEDGLKAVTIRFKDEAGNVSYPISSQIKLDRKPPASVKIAIDNNSIYTSNPSKQVKLSLFAEEATEMKISNDSTFFNTSWEPYTPTKSWTLVGEDGKKEVFVKFRDVAGNETLTIQDAIILDRTKPESGKITINDGKTVTNNPTITIKIEAAEAKQMIVSSNSTFVGSIWQKFESSKSLILQGQDGEKSVFIKFKDAAGNISDAVSSTILLDRKAPLNAKIKIDNGAPFTTDKEGKVLLSLEAEDGAEMIISNVSDFKGASWQSFQSNVEWKLPGEDGLKVIGARFRDLAGNETAPVIAKIKLAKSASVGGSIVINSDSIATKNAYRRVDLLLKAHGAKEMIIANSSDFKDGKWEEYTPQKVWTLTSGDGEKSVFVKFRGFVENESSIYTDKIILDQTPPTNCKIIINNDSSFTVNKKSEAKLKISASGASFMMLSNNPVFLGSKWEPYKTTKQWLLDKEDGVKTVYIKFKDELGNESEIISDRILLDKTAPQNVSIKINNGAEYTNNSNKAVTLVFISDDATHMRISNSPNIENVEWEKILLKKLNWILPGNDGEKRVYVQYRDESKNTTTVIYDKIILDRTPPRNCSFSINNDSTYTVNKDADVRLYMKGEEAKSILISNQKDFFGARWEAFKPFKEHWILDGEDGEKTIYMSFKDEAGNVYPDTISKKILLDRNPPRLISASLKENKNSSLSSNVTILIKATDAEMMEIKGEETTSIGWEPYQEIKEWKFTEGERNIWIRFKDKVGNISNWNSVLSPQ